MKPVFVLILCLAASTIPAADTTHLAGRGAKAPGPPGYQMVNDNDKEMEKATEDARRSLGFSSRPCARKRRATAILR